MSAGDVWQGNVPAGFQFLRHLAGDKPVIATLGNHEYWRGDTVEFCFSEHGGLLAAKRFFRKALERHGRPKRIVIDGSQTNYEAIVSCDGENRLRDRMRRSLEPIRIRRSQYLNNRIKQDHRPIKRRVRPMLGFKSKATATIILSGIEMVQMMRKRQARYVYNPAPALAKQFATEPPRQPEVVGSAHNRLPRHRRDIDGRDRAYIIRQRRARAALY